MTTLSLSNNRLTGEIPISDPADPTSTGLDTITLLGGLYLWGNRLTGPIPPELGNLNLFYLFMNGNRFSGEIPAELGRMDALLALDLSNNDLTGVIPATNDRDPATPCPTRSAFAVHDKMLCNLSLILLDLSGNQLSGSIPASLGNLRQLLDLDLSGNRLTGGIPASLGTYLNLRTLRLNGNRLTGPIPPGLGASIARTTLADLGYDPSDTTGSDLNNNEVTLIGLSRACGDLGLPGLDFDDDDQTCASLPSLELLWLHGNQLTGAIPPEIANISLLRQLTLSQNLLSGPIPARFGVLTNLRFLDLWGNHQPSVDRDSGLTGPIPSTLGNLVNLERLLLHQNRLSGTIPTELGKLSELQRLNLNENELAGPIPLRDRTDPFSRGFDDLVNLRILSLRDNRLTGTSFPAPLNGLVNLTRLSLSGNEFTGAFPAAFTRSVILEALDLSIDQVSSGGFTTRLLRLWDIYVDLPSGAALPAGADENQSYVEWDSLPNAQAARRAVNALPPGTLDLGDSPIYLEVNLGFRDSERRMVPGNLSVPAVVCVPRGTNLRGEQRLLRFDGEEITLLPPPRTVPAGLRATHVCGQTRSFSLFLPAVVLDPTHLRAPTIAGGARILRIEPDIRAATVSAGDILRLGVDVYGRQNLLDNALADEIRFEWDDGSANGSFDGDGRSVLYTAPDAPGAYTVTASLPSSACSDVEGECEAVFEIRVRRSHAQPSPAPAPINPAGEIPSILTDPDGEQYAVFTPVDGGAFRGDDVSLTAPAGAVPNGEIVGVRIYDAGAASNIGKTYHRYTISGNAYRTAAVDSSGSALSEYILNTSAEVCLPLPVQIRGSISDIALVALNADGSLTILSTKVRVGSDSSPDACGNLGFLPATLAVGIAGAPPPLPTPGADSQEIETPDTGGRVPSAQIMFLITIIGATIIAAGASIALGYYRRRGNCQ